eukprot:CAMPEP_0176425458 /NCGR_PEP_ID=MMETSP0127-20121128/11399_1 /TAXON_ID=938130 /ORGANISM="Platyophrya macrostoma, Strain WH" /LENGTH=526 /DNA_ID=CAMNT_0017806619 /DNA_START=43 /DNA_END=1623 /DNA_ORIENTATION=-
MNINWLPSEETELLVNVEDLPNFHIAQDTEENLTQGTPIEHARKFIIELQNALISNKTDELLFLYDRKFNLLCDAQFKTTMWPTVEEIEEDESIEIQINTFFLYNELTFRHAYARLQNNLTPEVRINTYKNYINFFNQLADTKEDIALPNQWIWDMLDEFLYQFQNFCQFRIKVKDENDSSYQYYLENIDDIWTFDSVLNILTTFVEKSKILQAGKNALAESQTVPNILFYCGHYSLVSLCRLHTLVCDYSAALKAVEPIDFKKLHIYTKSFPCLITLFYYAGFSYLMQKKYKESVKLIEFMLSFYLKYKQFYSKSYQFETMNKLAEKSLYVLSLGLVFYPTAIDENISAALREKYERTEKLSKYDLATFTEMFNYGSPKLMVAVKDQEHFKSFGFDKNYTELLNQQKELLLSEFQKIQQLNNLSGVLRLYSSIKLPKLAKVMKMSEDQLKELIDLYQARNNAPTSSSPFETTIVKKLVDSIPKMEIIIEKDNIKIKEALTKPNFAKIFSRNMQKIEEIVKDLEKI